MINDDLKRINDELKRMRDANRGKRDTPEMRMALLTGQQPAEVHNARGAAPSPEERMARLSPAVPELPPPAHESEPPPTDEIAALKLELSNAMTALQGLMMAAGDALNKAHEARDLYDDDFPEWPSGGEGGGGAFSGFVYVYGKKFDVTEYRGPRLRVVKGHGTSVQVIRTDLPIPDPMPANESWRELSQCPGDIYIDC